MTIHDDYDDGRGEHKPNRSIPGAGGWAGTWATVRRNRTVQKPRDPVATFNFILLLIAIFAVTMSFASAANSNPLVETRYCGAPKRNAAGHIIRRSDVRTAFRKIHLCPTTGLPQGPCPGWQMDHVVPLVCGGCDAVSNMQWLPIPTKIPAPFGKDRFERRIYCKINPAK